MTGKALAKRLIWGFILAAVGVAILYVLRNVFPANAYVVFGIAIALFLLGFFLAKSKKVEQVLPPITASDVQAKLDALLDRIREPASKAIYARVESIRNSILQTLPSIDNLADNTNKDVYLVRKVALEYLPSTLDNYLKIPYNVRRGQVLKDGKTAHDLMLEQLTLLDHEMKGIFESITKQETDQLRVHGRYLEQLFEKSDIFVN
ncbi:MAG: PrgI family protein [Trueperaceae bacterium]|nr:PrgI family protein [Trueperaceae bacterium]